jgi:NAD(P) transhydrogenase subunit alpha
MLEAPAVAALTILILALFVGVEVISKVPPLLHTPLMSGSNAISGISVVGAILATGSDHGQLATVLGFIAIAMAMFNVVGGFLVTNRMLAMFKKKPKS